jgi:two-component system, response regulator / RNA-binding antiterminator
MPSEPPDPPPGLGSTGRRGGTGILGPLIATQQKAARKQAKAGQMGLRILVIDEDEARAAALVQSLAEGGYETVGVIDPKADLIAKVKELSPDMIIVDMESPSRDTIEDMRRITADRPRSIVMFVDQSDETTTAEAMRLGISAYVIDGLNPARVKPILDVAMARFVEFQKLRNELDQAKMDLADRKIIDRAKALLMKTRNIPEEQAHRLMQKLAMDQNQRLVEAARSILALAQIFKPGG